MCAGSDSSSFFSLNDSLPGFGARTRLGSFGATGSVATAPGLPAFGFAGAAFVCGDGVVRFRDEGPLVGGGLWSCGDAFVPGTTAGSFDTAGPNAGLADCLKKSS